jgi:hypothetical protein
MAENKDSSAQNHKPLYDINLEDVRSKWLEPSLDRIQDEIASLITQLQNNQLSETERERLQANLDISKNARTAYQAMLEFSKSLNYTEDMIKRGTPGMTRGMIAGRVALLVLHSFNKEEDPVSYAEFLLIMMAKAQGNMSFMKEMLSFIDFTERVRSGEIPSITDMLTKIVGKKVDKSRFAAAKEECNTKHGKCDDCIFKEVCLALKVISDEPHGDAPDQCDMSAPINGQGEEIVKALFKESGN